jgi:TolB-like protein
MPHFVALCRRSKRCFYYLGHPWRFAILAARNQDTVSEPKESKEAEGKRLDSWKEIAAYLRKDVRTVQRWEKYEGLPVHRKPHEKLASVYAYVSELQAWWNDGHPENDSATGSNGSWNAQPSLVVLPLRNLSDDATQDLFSDGLTEEFIAQLGRIDSERLGVIAATTAMKYKINSKSIAQIARELGVSYILEGSVRRNDERVRISAALIRASDQTRLWSETYDREIRRILEVQVEVAKAVAREIASKVNVSQQRTHRRLVDPAAYSEYLRGRFFWNRRTPEAIARAIGCFEKAIVCDSFYGPAYAGLSDCYAILSSIHVGQTAPNDAMPKAIRAAKKALEIEPRLAEAYATLGSCSTLVRVELAGRGEIISESAGTEPFV